MTPTPAISSKTASHRPDIADGADARAVHCGLCNWKTAIYKHAYQGGGQFDCSHCKGWAHLSVGGRFALVFIRILVMGTAAFASVFGVQALTERYWQDAPYGLHFLPILVFGFVWVYLVEPKLVPALLPFKWREHGA